MIVKAPTLSELTEKINKHPEFTFRKPFKLRDASVLTPNGEMVAGSNDRTYWITFGVKTLDKKTG